MTGPSSFRLLNSSGQIATGSDWQGTGQDKLWLYHLHYFDDLAAEGWQGRREWHRVLLARWITENQAGHGIGWESYPLSRRIVNWIKWALANNGLDQSARHSLALQARFLAQRIEWHLLGNHLLANATALVFAGLYFEGSEADCWLYKGLDILAKQLPEQILQDGGHFERSPMYHSIVLADLLDLMNLAGVYPGVVPGGTVEAWKARALVMSTWLQAICHPDGEIAFFNDAALGIAAAPAAIEAYAQRLGLPATASDGRAVTHLQESGYIRLDLAELAALIDVAEVGPDYQPGHAHADTLSFEASLFGRRVLVNAGTSCYEAGPKRARQRATASHNTVEVDGEDSSEVWASFRVARRARPIDLEVSEDNGAIRIGCAHDGYRRLPGRVVHRRQWDCRAGSLRITDRMEGRFKTAVARFHVHPDVTVDAQGNEGALILPDGRQVTWSVEGAQARVAPSRYHPEFGLSIETACIEAAATDSVITTTFAWQ